MKRSLTRRLFGSRLARPIGLLAFSLVASSAGATAQPGTLWDNVDFAPGKGGSAFAAGARPATSSSLTSDDFFLDPADLEAAVDPTNPNSCPQFRITAIRTRMFPRAAIADRPWLLVIHAESPIAAVPAPASANALVAGDPPAVLGPVPNTAEVTISESPSVVDAIWDFSGSPITLPPGAYWIAAYKDVTGADNVGWWSPSQAVDLRNTGKRSSGNNAWADERDFDFDIDGLIVDPCPAPPTISIETIRGKVIRFSDRSEGTDPRRRRVRISALDRDGGSTLVGDPTVDGATLEVLANGTNPSAQVFSLPPELWREVPTRRGRAFRYQDPRGEAGPVTRVLLRSSDDGLFAIRAQILGGKDAAQPLELRPPDDGTDAYAVLEITGQARYCVKFGADGTVENRGARSFRIVEPTAEGCPET